MGMTRRSLLLGGLTLTALLAARRGPAVAGDWPRPAIVLITGVDWSSDAVRLATVFQPFTLRKIPVTVSLSPFGSGDHKVGRDSAVVALLRETVDEDPDLVEVAIDLGAVESIDPYFQLRQASDAQAMFSWLMNPIGDKARKRLVTGLTAVSGTPVRSFQDFAGMRAAGLRSVIHVPEDGTEMGIQKPAGGYWMTETGLANVFGEQLATAKPPKKNRAVPLGSQLNDLRRHLQSDTHGDEPIIFRLRFEVLSELSPAELAAFATDFADVVREAADGQQHRNVLPSNLYRQSRPEAARYVIIRIDDFRVRAEDDSSHFKFVTELLDLKYPVTEGVVPAGIGLLDGDLTSKSRLQALLNNSGFDVALQGWEHGQNEGFNKSFETNLDKVTRGARQLYLATGKPVSSYVPTNNSYDDNLLDAIAAAGMSVFSAERGDNIWFSGMDKRGLLHASNSVSFEAEWSSDTPYLAVDDVLARIGDVNDTVFTINPRTATTPEKKRSILEVLAKLIEQPGTSLANMATYYHQVVPQLAKPELVRYAKAEVRIRDPKPGIVDAAMESQLLADAALAWEFFDWSASKFKGMVAGTAWEEYGRRTGYPFATQWDFGSYILAAVCAHRLRVIDQAKFEKTITTILKFIGQSSYSFRGVRLPEVERAIGKEKPEGRGFDCADTGRLLIALRVLENYAPKTFPIAKLVATWGLKYIIIDGMLHSVTKGKLVVVPYNSYSHYVRQGYLSWGLDVAPVFDDWSLDMDGSVHLLNEIERRGRIATEPTVTEEIEIGSTEQTRLITDVLYGAQIKRYRETGILTCRSEGPIDGPPYFTYQGYQLTPDGGEFVVDGRDLEQKAQLGDNWRLVSTKGCFLWHAARPGEYSDKLIQLVRNNGRIEGLGFASGIHESTGKATALTDVNTNGLILESIAYILNGRNPLAEFSNNIKAAK